MKKQAVGIGDVVGKVMEQIRFGKASEAEALNSSWIRAVGNNGLKHSKPVDIKEGILIINVDSSGWIHKFSMDKPAILSKMSKELGNDVIKDIKFRIGEL